MQLCTHRDLCASPFQFKEGVHHFRCSGKIVRRNRRIRRRRMTLYYNPISNNARVVHWFATAADIPVKIEVINFATGDHKKPEFLKINPAGQVPAFKDGDVSAYER